VKQLSQRQRRFCQLYVEGKSPPVAYAEAGYAHDKSYANCYRLLTGNDGVKQEIANLQRIAMQKHEITVESLVRELEEARANAKKAGQPASEVSAVMAKAKLLGLVVDKREVSEKTVDKMDAGEITNLLRERLAGQPELLRLLGIEDDKPAPPAPDGEPANVTKFKKRA
jgi:phage terminase small subunit